MRRDFTKEELDSLGATDGILIYSTRHTDGLPGWFSHKAIVIVNKIKYTLQTKLPKSPDIAGVLRLLKNSIEGKL